MPSPAPLILPALVAPGQCRAWLAQIDAAAAALPFDHPDRQATSGSLRLRSLGPLADAIVDALGRCTMPRPRIDAAARLLVDDCWIRCQHPAATRPPGQFPHAWHQDGALGSRFETGARLRPLRTLWLALVDCGDVAPSLEWIEAPSPGLLRPAELIDCELAGRFATAVRRHARLRPGDALRFGGELIHRTHVTPAMTLRRVSIELRWELG